MDFILPLIIAEWIFIIKILFFIFYSLIWVFMDWVLFPDENLSIQHSISVYYFQDYFFFIIMCCSLFWYFYFRMMFLILIKLWMFSNLFVAIFNWSHASLSYVIFFLILCEIIWYHFSCIINECNSSMSWIFKMPENSIFFLVFVI